MEVTERLELCEYEGHLLVVAEMRALGHGLPMLPLQSATASGWLAVALGDLDAVLCDHAHCERKAAATAMSLVAMYPERPDLVRRMTKLAQEELRHFQQVYAHIEARALELGRDPGDPYAQALMSEVRSAPDDRLMDRLLVAALIEARSCERLELLARGLEDAELARFYAGLAKAEAGHTTLFVDLARRYADPEAVERRLEELAASEARVVEGLPLLPRIH